MKNIKIIYVMDPICGWCYGNIQNTTNLFNDFKDIVDFEILPGGMWSGSNVRVQSPQMTKYFLKHDASITDLTGVQFGEKYLDFINKRHDVLLDSEIPSRAIETISRIEPRLSMLFTVEVLKARFSFGKDFNLKETYIDILSDLGIDEKAFFDYFDSIEAKDNTLATFKKAAEYATSYPTILAEKNGKVYILEQGFTPYEKLKDNVSKIIHI